MKRWLLGIGLLACMARVMAEPLVRVEARLQPQPPYQVGSTLRLEVDLLSTTWFTQAPQPPALDLPGALVTPPNGQGDKLSETLDGTGYFGLRLTYLISPTRAGQFNIAALPFTLQLGQATAPVQVTTALVGFSVAAGAAVGAPDNLLVASRVSMQQKVEPSAKPLKVGDRIVRHIEIEAMDAQAMLIPPSEFVDIPGLKRYPLPPEVSTLSDGRGSMDGGRRIDSVSYVVEQAGDYSLPAIELSWWDSSNQSKRDSKVAAIEFEAESAGSFVLPFSLEADLQKLGRGRLLHISGSTFLLAAAVLLGLLGYFARQPIRLQWQRVQLWREQLRQRWLESEAWAWRELQQALRTPSLPLAELYRWLQRFQGSVDLRWLSAQLPAEAAEQMQQALVREYSAQPSSATSNTALRNSLAKVRSRRLRTARMHAKGSALQSLRPWILPQPDNTEEAWDRQ